MWETVTALFREYMGTGLIAGWFLVSVIYLFLRERDQSRRILFLYTPTILLILFFNPLFAKIVYGYVGNEIYYRILWLIPITLVIAYAAAKICGGLSGKKKGVFTLAAIAAVVLSGSCIYQNPYFRRAENIYHMPQAVVDICDAIVVPGREVMAVFPPEMLQYVRQYTPLVCMPYGRDVLVESWGTQQELYYIMEAEELDVEAMVPFTRGQYQCHYIILPEDKPILGSMEDNGYVLYANIDGYDIYLDPSINRTLEYLQ